MSMTKTVLVKVYTGVISAAVTLVAQRALTVAWKAATGDDATPDPHDPDTPLRQALLWALASGIGLGAAQLLTARFTQRRLRALSDPV
ncbi:DUF4235 domain-containing protein [Propionicicella superfundia]|uniref:DUF4235 domain-containing protein n=1 Tax=Propionicicella superfundia TaxID=348582 RepID=UPI0004259886|nr:DUF4235 domain-containing protein [Propionicicella superfundia]